MDYETRQKVIEKLLEAKERCNFGITNLEADEPYSLRDQKILRAAKSNIIAIREKLSNPYPPIDPEPMHICKYPLPEVKKANGCSIFGYEGLTYFEVEDFITAELFDECADLMAKNAVNLHRFFAFVTGDNYTKDCVQVFPKYSDGYDMAEISSEYIEIVGPRLQSLFSRQISAMVCMVSGIKNIAGRWDQNPLNGKNNSNGTTEDVDRFYDDPETIKMTKRYIKNFFKIFDDPYLIYELVNEPNTSIGRLVSWNWELIDYMHDELGIPYNRIAINKFDSSKIYDFLKKGIYVSAHNVRSEKTVRRFAESGERIPLLLSPTFILSGDGADEFDEAVGLVGLYHNKKYQDAAARQKRNMQRIDLTNHGYGIEFMPALVFIDGVMPNLQRIIDHGENGFTKEELEDLSRKLSVDLMQTDNEGNYLNEWGELREIRAAFVNNLEI